MTDKKDEVFWIELGFLPVEVGYAPNKRAWAAASKQYGLSTEDYPSTDGHCSWWAKAETSKNVILITVSKQAEDYSVSQVAGIVAHECTHAWRFIKDAIGEKEPSEEFEAYVMQAMVQGVLFAHQQRRAKPWKQP